MCRGIRLDNPMQVEHNVQISCHYAISGHLAISGSAEIRNFVVADGQTLYSMGRVGQTPRA